VKVAKTDLPTVNVGSVIHVSVNARGESRSFNLRGIVGRRDENGLALKWIADAVEDQKSIAALLDVIKRMKA
jgi:hypothetical protein